MMWVCVVCQQFGGKNVVIECHVKHLYIIFLVDLRLRKIMEHHAVVRSSCFVSANRDTMVCTTKIMLEDEYTTVPKECEQILAEALDMRKVGTHHLLQLVFKMRARLTAMTQEKEETGWQLGQHWEKEYTSYQFITCQL